MSTYPRYATWRDHATGDYEIVRWLDTNSFEIVQCNIRTYEKAHRALADWRAREGIHERLKALAAMEADMHALNIKLERDIDAG